VRDQNEKNMNVVNFCLPSRPYFRRKLAAVAASQSYLARDLPYVSMKESAIQIIN